MGRTCIPVRQPAEGTYHYIVITDDGVPVVDGEQKRIQLPGQYDSLEAAQLSWQIPVERLKLLDQIAKDRDQRGVITLADMIKANTCSGACLSLSCNCGAKV